MKFILPFCLLGLISCFHLFANPRTPWAEGHGDLGIHYDDGKINWTLFEGNPPEEVEVVLGPETQLEIPNLAAFGFLGHPGDPVWVMPQVQSGTLPFIGFDIDVPNGLFVGNRIDILLDEVAGPGSFLMWTAQSASSVDVVMNSRDGLNRQDLVNAPAPGHLHQNWGFSAPGTYHLGFRAEGILAASQTPLISRSGPINRFKVNVLDAGEVDLEVLYEDGQWELVLLREEDEVEFHPGEAALHAGPATWRTVANDPAFSFLGDPGRSVYILPQEEEEGVLFLGVAGDEIATGLFERDRVFLELVKVEGPGDVFLFSTDAFGRPTVYFNSSDGIDPTDAFPVEVGGHGHQNWAFSEPGFYKVDLRATGTVAESGTPTAGAAATFFFEVFPPVFFSEGELDIEIAFEDGLLEIVALDEAREREYHPSEVVVRAGSETRQTIPNDPAFAFLGSPGGVVNILPQSETEGVVFLGIAGDEVPVGVFEDDRVDLKLVGLRGPGSVFLYEVDAFGAPTVFFNSADGIDESDVFPVSVGGHSHQNWGFTAPGIYKLDLQAAGMVVQGELPIASDVVTLTFEVFGESPDLVAEPEIEIEVGFEDGEWEIALLDALTLEEFSTEDLGLNISLAAATEITDDPAFAFLGNAGDLYYQIPQNRNTGILFLGVAGDELRPGDFENNEVRLHVVGVDGPGDLFIYETDAFGRPSVLVNSRDGLGGEDFYPVPVGGHNHANWGFSKRGFYQVGVRASGTLASSGQSSTSDIAVLYFAVAPREVFDEGEIDLEIAYEDGAFKLVLLEEANEREIEAGDGVLTAKALTLEPVPNDPAFAFLGYPGDRVFILAQEEREGVLFLGIAGDELPVGEFVDDSVQLNLVEVRGPGAVFLYSTDAFGMPTKFFDSSDGLNEEDSFPVGVGGHSHQNWGFSSAGRYEVSLQASGVRVVDGQEISSDPVTFYFEIIEPEVYNEGELDLEVAYEDDGWEVALLDEANDREVEPESVLLQGVPEIRRTVPNDPAFAFQGMPGQRIWILPQEEVEGVLFLGIAGDEIPTGVFEGDLVDLQLSSVRGAGDVFLYEVDAFGAPTVFFNSADGIDESDVFPVSVGGHSHQNWGFTAPGVYKVMVRPFGIKDGVISTGEAVEITFEILPESTFTIHATLQGQGLLRLEWKARPGVNYQVQSKINDILGEWMNEGESLQAEGSSMAIELEIAGEEMKIFRLVELGN